MVSTPNPGAVGERLDKSSRAKLASFGVFKVNQRAVLVRKRLFMFDDGILHLFTPCETVWFRLSADDEADDIIGHELYVLPNGELALSQREYWINWSECETWYIIRRWCNFEAFQADADYLNAIFGYVPEVDVHYWVLLNFDEALRLGLS
jgi:hypothetical protein